MDVSSSSPSPSLHDAEDILVFGGSPPKPKRGRPRKNAAPAKRGRPAKKNTTVPEPLPEPIPEPLPADSPKNSLDVEDCTDGESCPVPEPAEVSATKGEDVSDVSDLPALSTTAVASEPVEMHRPRASPEKKESNIDYVPSIIVESIRKNMRKYFDEGLLREFVEPLFDTLREQITKFYQETAEIYIMVAAGLVLVSVIMMMVSLYISIKTYQRIQLVYIPGSV